MYREALCVTALTSYIQVYQGIEFLFFFALVICAQRMLSHFIGMYLLHKKLTWV